MENLTRRGFVELGAFAAAAFILAGCSSGGPGSGEAEAPGSSSEGAGTGIAAAGDELRLVTGGQAGTYYAFGKLLAQHATENAGIAVTALTSDGSKANVESLEDGLAELAFCQSDVMAYAHEGTNLFEGAAFESLTAVAVLYDEPVQIVTCDDDIETVADLKGKRVSIGAPNSGVYFNAIDILAAYDITEDDITPTYQTFGDSAESLRNGQIDAAFVVAGVPTKAVEDLASSNDVYLVGIDDTHMKNLLELSPYYAKFDIPAGTYAGQGKAGKTVAVSAVLLASKDASDDDVYAFVKDVFDSAADEQVASSHGKYSELAVEKGASITAVPYHKGAAKFFQEKGLTVATA